MQTTEQKSLLYRFIKRVHLLIGVRLGGSIANFERYSDSPRKVLFMPAAGLGDTIMAAPAIRAFKQKYPDAQITLLEYFNKGKDGLLPLMGYVDKMIDMKIAWFKYGSVVFMLYRYWILLRALRKEKFDLVISFVPTLTIRLLVAGIGSKYWLYNNRVDDYPGTIALELLKPLGVDKSSAEPAFDICAPADAERILPADLPRPFIGIHPFCGYAWKQWSGFDRLQQKLSRTPGTVIVLGKEVGYAPRSDVYDLVNKLSLPELFWVIKRLDVFVTADAGPMHISMAVGTPTVALFGLVGPDLLTNPQYRADHILLYKSTELSESHKTIRQRNPRCKTNIELITVDEVVSAVDYLLGAPER